MLHRLYKLKIIDNLGVLICETQFFDHITSSLNIKTIQYRSLIPLDHIKCSKNNRILSVNLRFTFKN